MWRTGSPKRLQRMKASVGFSGQRSGILRFVFRKTTVKKKKEKPLVTSREGTGGGTPTRTHIHSLFSFPSRLPTQPNPQPCEQAPSTISLPPRTHTQLTPHRALLWTQFSCSGVLIAPVARGAFPLHAEELRAVA